MPWKKFGNIFSPENFPSIGLYSFAAVPFIGKIHNNLIDVFFTMRNAKNQSVLFKGVFDFDDNKKLVYLSPKPIIYPGVIGSFDEDGVMGCQFLSFLGNDYIYYQGWNISQSVPFRNSIGVAKWNKESNSFEKMFNGPILDRSIYDPCFVATPNVFKLKDNQFIMFYLSCDKWEKSKAGLKHWYNIKIAHSNDGIHWTRNGEVAIDYSNDFEYAISVPRVVYDNGIYKMWYSYRGGKSFENYRIGYAESKNVIDWVRKDDEVGIQQSEEGWDSEMICYPCVFHFKGQMFMLFNGNNYGKTGFGLAIWKN